MASAWSTSWGVAWGNSWGAVGSVTPEPEPDSHFTSAGGRAHGATQWAYKTLSELRREEEARKRKLARIAKRKVKEAADSGINLLPELVAVAKQEIIFEGLPNWLDDVDAERIAASIMREILKQAEREEEEILLFLS